MAPPKDIARSYPKRGITADVGFRSEPKFCGDGAATFPTTSDYAQAAASADLALGETYTLCAWIRSVKPSGANHAVNIGVSSTTKVSIALFGGVSNPEFYCYNGVSNMNTTNFFYSDPHTWYHVAMVIKPGAGNSQIFINGIDRTAPHSSSFPLSGSPVLHIGGYYATGNGDWQGDLANVALFTSSLTEDQVRQAMRASDYASHAAIATLEAFYPLSENFNDSTGNHNATASGSPEFRPNRPQLPRGLDLARGAAQARVYTGRAVQFDGSTDHMEAAVYSNASDYYSVSVWVKPDAIGANRNIVASGDTGDNAFLIFLLSTGAVYFYGNDTTGDYAIIHQTILEAGRWYHLAMAVDQSDAANNTIKAYIDGVENTTSKSAQGWVGNSTALEIAARNSTTLFDGAIAGVKVFNSQLTAAQIQELYHNPEQVLPTGVSASNLRRYYPLSDYNDTGGTGGRWFQDMGADGEPAEDQGSASMEFAQPVPCPQLGLQQSATRVYFEDNTTRGQATLGAAPGTTCTMSAWVMVDEQSPYQYLMKNGTNITANAFFAFAIDNYRRLYAVQSSAIKATSSILLSGYGEWNHVVAMTKSTAPYVRFFINGVEDTSITDSGMVAFNLTSTIVDIGSDGGANHLRGFLNDCAIWDVELSDPEVAALYNSGVQGMDLSTVQSANLKGWWKCDDLTSFKDYSGNGANAALTGAVGAAFNAASFPENASGSTIVGDFSMKRKGVSVLNPTATPAVLTVAPGAQIANDGSLSPDPSKGGYSFSAFIRLEQASGANPWFPIVFSGTNYATASQRYILNFGNYSVATFPPGITISDGSTPRDYDWPSVLSNPEEWHQLAFTIDFTTSPNTTFRLYLDGALVSTQATHVHTGFDPGDILVGSYPYGNGNFPGAIACFKMYQTKLSDNEIEQIYNSDLRLIKGLANE